MLRALILTLCLGLPGSVLAADVIAVDVTRNSDGTYRIAATIRSEETGWDKYADKWQVLGPDGSILGTRVLHHPHVSEQPFTRALPALRLPADIAEIRVRAHDSVTGFGGVERVVTLPRPAAPARTIP